MNGNVLIDFMWGVFVAILGVRNKKVAKGNIWAHRKPLLLTFLYSTKYRVKLSEKLVKISPKGINKVLILSTGAEMTETICCTKNGKKEQNHSAIQQYHPTVTQKWFYC